jgi:TrmH family RNA methyltransferase
MITSRSNDRVKYVRKLQDQKSIRHHDRRFVLEGVRLVEEVMHAGVVPTFVFYTEALANDARGKALLATLQALDAPCYTVGESVMEDCSDTVTPQGILAVLPFPDLEAPKPLSLALVVDGVRDPGNLGTLLRTALAAGVQEVMLAPSTVDFSNPKVVRSAMGAHLRLPIRDGDWNTIAEAVSGCDAWLAGASGGVNYTEVDWTPPVALIVGSEACGAGDRARALARGRVSIPMNAPVESLNAAIAGAVILFEVVRQRWSLGQPPGSP